MPFPPVRAPLTPDETYEWMTPEEAARPIAGIVQVMLYEWWAVDAQGRIAVHNPIDRRTGRRSRATGVPVCNRSEAIARTLAARTYGEWAVDVVQLPIAFLRVDISEYQH